MSEYFDNVKSWKLGNISSLSVLQDIAEKNNIHITSPQFCEILDANDKLSHLRKEFIIPKLHSYPGGKLSINQYIIKVKLNVLIGFHAAVCGSWFQTRFHGYCMSKIF